MKRLVFLATLLFLASSQIALAEISNPYVVDEKSQVIFGDSTEIVAASTYKGLENYATEYVGDYLHITFSYTHSGCCTAAYPPSFYITSLDPTATTTLVVRENAYIFPLSSQPTHLTDVYFYDIQFDPTGYTAVVTASDVEVVNFHKNITDIATTDYVALANHYLRQNPSVAFSMSFAPLSIYDVPEVEVVATTTPVIIVPGIMGSKLLKENVIDNLVWPNTVQIVTSVTDDFLDVLEMDSNGLPVNSNIIKGDIIKTLNNSNYWEGLFNELNDEDSFEFPYDWRLDIETIATELMEKIEEVKASRGVDKVDLVAHSMGGLLVKKYLKDHGGSSVSKFIDIGTPHTGAPSSYKTIMYGDDLGVKALFGLININSNRIKQISQNMPSVYQLLPSASYFDDYEYYVWDGDSANNRLDFSETSEYLKLAGRNNALVDRANTLHQEIDGLNPADYGVETYNFVGCGVPTLGQFYILQDGEHPIYNIKMIDGDGTVPRKSAEDVTASSTYYVDGIQHALLPSTSGVKELVVHILSTTTPFDISPYTNISTTSAGCSVPDGKLVSMHSPIELHVYDSSGNHVGPDENGDIENSIGGAIYEVLGDNKFVFLPDGVDYVVEGDATGSGTFDVRIQELVSGEVVTTTVYGDMPLGIETRVQFPVGAEVPSQISVDANGDGIYDHEYGVSTVASGVLESTGKVALSGVVGVTNTVITSARPSTSAPGVEEVVEDIDQQPTTTEIPRPVVQEVQKITRQASSTDTLELALYDNTAIAYKSFGYKFKSLFKSIWRWVRVLHKG